MWHCSGEAKEKQKEETAANKMDMGAQVDSDEVKAAAAAAIGAAAARAKVLADAEEREIQRLVAMVVEVQLRKLDAKLEHFHQLEQVLEKERLQVPHHPHSPLSTAQPNTLYFSLIYTYRCIKEK
jgi:SWI/SNF related-matrix-associated actin-dependent regulator of chromatin subfamily C